MLSKRSLRLGFFLAATVAFPATAHAETLMEALASAYRTNPQISSALLGVKSTAENIALANAGRMPQIGANVSTTRSWSSVGGSWSSSQTTTANLSYSQTLFDSFQTDAEIDQARALTEVAMHSLNNAEQNVLLQAASAYMSVIRDTALVQLRADNMSFLKAQVQSAKDRLQLGEGTRIEVAQAETRFAQAVSSYRTAVNALQESRATYERWIGHGPENLSQSFPYEDYLPNSLDAALARAIEVHPAILSAQAQFKAAQFASDAARAAFGPTLALVGSICTFECTTSGTYSTTGSVRLTLSIPIYQGGSIRASARKANFEQIKSEFDLMATRNEVREAVIAAWSGLQSAAAQIAATTAAVESGRLVLEGAIAEQEAGEGTTLDVLDARADLTSLQESLISARTSRVIAAVSLLSAVGKLSPEELGLVVEIRSPDGSNATVGDIWQELRTVPGN